MKVFTQEQLISMSDYEINCAVAKKFLKYDFMEDPKIERVFKLLSSDHECCDLGDVCIDRDYDPLNYPNDYMLIAEQHEISITFDRDQGEIFCSSGVNEEDETTWMLKNRIGRAVCECFLMMEIEK